MANNLSMANSLSTVSSPATVSNPATAGEPRRNMVRSHSTVVNLNKATEVNLKEVAVSTGKRSAA